MDPVSQRLTRRIRVNISQSVKGIYTADTTAEVEWSDDGAEPRADRIGVSLTATLLEAAKMVADEEIARRKALDAALEVEA